MRASSFKYYFLFCCFVNQEPICFVMAKISNTDTLNKIKEILSSETDEQSQYRLMPNFVNVRNDFEKVLSLLNKLKQGILERKN